MDKMQKGLSLAISNIGFAEQDDDLVCGWLKELGFCGLEVAPTRLVGENPYDKCGEAAQKAQRLREEYGLTIPSMQSIWFGQTGNLFDPADAARLADYTRRAAAFAAAVGCPSMVFGNPRQRFVLPSAAPTDALGFFAEICAQAARQKTAIALEANPPIYGTNFCNTSEQAFAYARKVPGLRVNYDLGTLLINGESLDVLFENLDLVSHIHLSEPELAPIQPRPIHQELAARLRQAGYGGFVSIEMKTQPAPVVRQVLEYAAEVFL